MASTFTNLSYHVVFSTKYRRRTITTVRDELYKVMGGIIRDHDGRLIEIGGVEDHAHLLVGIPAKRAVADMIRVVKSNSAKWYNERHPGAKKFQWQTGYGAFTVSHSNCEAVQRYIRNQQAHHATQTFEEEFIELLKRHNIAYDPQYLFEAEHVG